MSKKLLALVALIACNGAIAASYQMRVASPGVQSPAPSIAVLSGTGESLDVISFPSTLVGETSQQQLTIANTGNSPVAFAAPAVTVDAPFAVNSSNCPAGGSLAKGASCTLTLLFTPAAAQAYNGTLATHSDANLPSITVSGAGTLPYTPAPPGAQFALLKPFPEGVLSADKLSVDHGMYTSGWSLGQATIGKNSGKWYWEATLTRAGSGALVGANPIQASTGNYGTYMYMAGGVVYWQGGGAGAPVYRAGDTVGVLLDLDSRTITYKPNCGSALPLTSLPAGTYYPSTAGQSGTNWALNFGQKPFRCAVPNGYNAGVWQ